MLSSHLSPETSFRKVSSELPKNPRVEIQIRKISDMSANCETTVSPYLLHLPTKFVKNESDKLPLFNKRLFNSHIGDQSPNTISQPMDTPKPNGGTRDLSFETRTKQPPMLNLSGLTPNLIGASPKSANKVTGLSPSPMISYKGAAHYRIRAKMGEGAVGEVYQVIHKQTCEVFALKRVNKMTASMVSILNI
jgi:hypothetical protein